MSGRAPRAMLALVVAVGGGGLLLLASSLLRAPETGPAQEAVAPALRSVTVVPLVAKDDPSLAPAAFHVSEELARLLGEALPHVRVVAGDGHADAAATRFLLEGEVVGHGDDVEVILRVVDRRGGRVAAASRAFASRARFSEAGARLAPVARRLVTAAMLDAAAAD